MMLHDIGVLYSPVVTISQYETNLPFVLVTLVLGICDLKLCPTQPKS